MGGDIQLVVSNSLLGSVGHKKKNVTKSVLKSFVMQWYAFPFIGNI